MGTPCTVYSIRGLVDEAIGDAYGDDAAVEQLFSSGGRGCGRTFTLGGFLS